MEIGNILQVMKMFGAKQEVTLERLLFTKEDYGLEVAEADHKQFGLVKLH